MRGHSRIREWGGRLAARAHCSPDNHQDYHVRFRHCVTPLARMHGRRNEDAQARSLKSTRNAIALERAFSACAGGAG